MSALCPLHEIDSHLKKKRKKTIFPLFCSEQSLLVQNSFDNKDFCYNEWSLDLW